MTGVPRCVSSRRLERALRAELGVAPSRAAEKLRERLLAEESAGSPPAAQQSSARRCSRSILSAGIGSANGSKDWSLEVSAGHGRTLFISGPAGRRQDRDPGAGSKGTVPQRGMRVGSGAAAQIEGAWPYAPVLEAVADLCRRHPALLDGLDDALREEIERALSGRETAWRAQSGDQRLFVAVTELVRLAAAGAGAVLVVDDAHDADDASAAADPLPGPQHPHGPGADRDRAPAEAVPGAGAGPAEPARPRQRRHPGPEHAAARRRGGRWSAGTRPEARPELIDAVWAASDGLPFAVVELARTSVDGRPNAETCCRPRCPPPRSTRWPRRPCSASPSTPTSSSR